MAAWPCVVPSFLVLLFAAGFGGSGYYEAEPSIPSQGLRFRFVVAPPRRFGY